MIMAGPWHRLLQSKSMEQTPVWWKVHVQASGAGIFWGGVCEVEDAGYGGGRMNSLRVSIIIRT